MEATHTTDQCRKESAAENRRWARPRSNRLRRSDPSNGIRDFRNSPRERRTIFNGRNSDPRRNSGGRGLHTRNNLRPMTMDSGPPSTLQTFRSPLPRNNSCHFNSHGSNPNSIESSRNMTYSNQSLADRLHENTNRAFNSHPYQYRSSFSSGTIPANHIRIPSVIRRHQSNSLQSNHLNGFFFHSMQRRMVPNQSWDFFPSYTGTNHSIGNQHRTGLSKRMFHSEKLQNHSREFLKRGVPNCARRRGSSIRSRGHYLRNKRPRPVSRTKRHLRWRNNYRDLQREIRCYFRVTSRDPLGLDDILRENRRRDNLGLTPLRGDSAMNTPAYSLNTPVPHRDIEHPQANSHHVELVPRIHTNPEIVIGLADQRSDSKNDTAVEPSETTRSNVQHRETERNSALNDNTSSIESTNDSNMVRDATSGNVHQEQEQRRDVQAPATNRVSPGYRKRVIRDPFHQRHRNVVVLNTNGNSRFNERTITGNYHNYYTRRPTTVTESTFRQYIESRRCLDIGCNSGEVTIRLAEMNPISMVGLDSDGRLIQEARRALERARRAQMSRHGGGSTSHSDDSNYNNVTFQTADYVPDAGRTFEPKYDTIIALSVTKWVHLVYGDAGIRRFFQRVFEELREGGHFLVEPQLLPSYRKSYQPGVHCDPDTQLHIRPPFDTELIEMGFTSEGCAIDGRPDSTDFRSRCVYIYSKKAPEAISTNQLNAGYPRPPPCYYYPSPIYRGLVSSQPSSSLNFPMTPSHASPTGSYLNEAPGPSHVLSHPEENYSYSDSEDFLPPGPSVSHEHSSDEVDDNEVPPNSDSELEEGPVVPFDPMPLNYILPIDEAESSTEDTNSGALSEASTSASQSASGIGRSSLKMKLKRLDHPNGSFSWTIDDSCVYDTDEDEDDLPDETDDDLILEAEVDDEEIDEVFSDEERSSVSRISLDPWDLSDRHCTDDSSDHQDETTL